MPYLMVLILPKYLYHDNHMLKQAYVNHSVLYVHMYQCYFDFFKTIVPVGLNLGTDEPHNYSYSACVGSKHTWGQFFSVNHLPVLSAGLSYSILHNRIQFYVLLIILTLLFPDRRYCALSCGGIIVSIAQYLLFCHCINYTETWFKQYFIHFKNRNLWIV